MKNDYRDILHLPHHQSEKRQRMSLHDRAAQFAPFAALRGYDEEIAETTRLTDERAELSSEEIAQLNEKLHSLLDHIKEKPEAAITYFVPDERKEGGAYVTVKGRVRRIDESARLLYFVNGTAIRIDDIFDIMIQN